MVLSTRSRRLSRLTGRLPLEQGQLQTPVLLTVHHPERFFEPVVQWFRGALCTVEQDPNPVVAFEHGFRRIVEGAFSFYVLYFRVVVEEEPGSEEY